MKRKTLLAIPVAVLAVAAFAPAPIVWGHNATATPSCTGLSAAATNYNKEVTNSIVAKVDGTIVYQDLDFKASASFTHPWSQTAPHAWSVDVDGPPFIGDDGKWHDPDRHFSGTWQACQTVPAPTTTTSSTTVVTTVAPTSTLVPDVSGPTTVVTEPVLPRTGLDGTIVLVAAILVIGGVFLVLRGRRVQ